MCFSLFRAASSCVRIICGIVFCLLCCGPICLIVGIVLLASENNREENVKEFNSFVQNYNTAPISLWVPGSIGANSVSLVSQNVVVFGNQKDVLPARSRLLSTQGGFSTTASYTLNNVSPFTRAGIVNSRMFFSNAYCDNSFGCSNSAMNNYCIANFGPEARFNSGGFCSSRGTCGQCRYPGYLTEYCVAVDSTGVAPYQQSSRYRSCFYPFGENDQRFDGRSSPTSIFYTVRQSDDPFIALQRLTEGAMDFGALREDQRNAGIALVVVGSVVIVCMIVAVVCIYRHVSRTKDASASSTSAHPAGAAHHTTSVPQQPYYPSTHTAYPVQGGGGGAYNQAAYSPSGAPMQNIPPTAYQPQQPPPNFVTNNGGYGYDNAPQQQQPYYNNNTNNNPNYYNNNNNNNSAQPDGYGYGNNGGGGGGNAYGYS